MTANPQTQRTPILSSAETIRQLRATPAPKDGVLSVYLNTAAQNVPGHAYVTAFNEACRTAGADIAPESERAFDAAIDRAKRYLLGEFQGGAPGLALFTSAEPGYFFAVRLPVVPQEELAWHTDPLLEPLEECLDAYGRTAVVLFDTTHARLYTLFLGAVESRQEFSDSV